MWRIDPREADNNSKTWPAFRFLPALPTVFTSTPQLEGRKSGAQSGKSNTNRESSAQLLSQFIEQPVQILVGLAHLFDLVDGVKHGGVMLAAELAPDLGQRGFCQVLGQVHGDLPRIDDRAGIVLGLNFDQTQTELLRDRLLNGLDGHLSCLRVDEVLQDLLGVGKRDLGADQRRVGHKADKGAFQLANVGPDVGGDEQRDIGGQGYFFLLGLLLKNCDFGLQVRRLDVGDQAPLEATAQAILDLGQFLGRTIAGNHDLLHRLVQRVEGVEELFLGALFLREELDVVDEQDIHVPELVAEAGHLVVAQRVDHFVGEFLAGDVADGRLRRTPLDFMANSLHQMGLAHAHAAVQEQWVVGLRGTLGYGLAGGMRKLVAATDHKCVERVSRVELCGTVPIKARLRGLQADGLRLADRGGQAEASIVTDGRVGGVVVGGDELYVLVFEAEVVDGLLNQVGILVAHMTKLGGGNAHEEDAVAGVTIAGGFEPGIVRVAVDFLFQRIEDAGPRIRNDGRRCNGHYFSKINIELPRQKFIGNNLTLTFEIVYLRTSACAVTDCREKFTTKSKGILAQKISPRT